MYVVHLNVKDAQGGRSFAVSYLFIGFVPMVRVSSGVFVCASMSPASLGGLRWLRSLIVAFPE